MADWDTRELAQAATTEDCAEVSDEGIRDVNSRSIVDESNELPLTRSSIKSRVSGDPAER
jgi:hypothetical protein